VAQVHRHLRFGVVMEHGLLLLLHLLTYKHLHRLVHGQSQALETLFVSKCGAVEVEETETQLLVILLLVVAVVIMNLQSPLHRWAQPRQLLLALLALEELVRLDLEQQVETQALLWEVALLFM
jgi:hypothetical protein